MPTKYVNHAILYVNCLVYIILFHSHLYDMISATSGEKLSSLSKIRSETFLAVQSENVAGRL